MLTERVNEILFDFPWIPDDYARVMAKVEPGQWRYGLEWFDGPQRPQASSVLAAFPSAFWIGRRHGNPVGYHRVGSPRPELCEWGRSEAQVRHRYGGIDQLILRQHYSSEGDWPMVPHELSIEGVAFGPWDNGAFFILSPGREATGLGNILAILEPGFELTLVCRDSDRTISVCKREGNFELKNRGHGWEGDWRSASRETAFSELLAAAPYNDGSTTDSFGRLVVPPPV